MTWLPVVVGLAIVVTTGISMVATVVVPRGRSIPQLLPMAVLRLVREFGVVVTKPIGDFRKKDGFLATIGPVAVLTQLAVFLGLFFLGYTIASLPWEPSLPAALVSTGSSLFTLGLLHTSGGHGNDVLGIAAAATGAVAIALQIGYLPAIYQAFNRRESLVTLMESRAGVPAWGPELLVRHQLVHTIDALGPFYRDWELWSADLAETHVSYPVLVYFRSPEPWYSWVLALLAALDAAAMHLALCPSTAPSEARQCLRMGFTALRRIASTLNIPYDPDPAPDAALRLRFDEFAAAIEVLAEYGFPMERSPAEAWPHFAGWRVNYEDTAYRLADLALAPRAPWSGERRSLGAETTMPARPPHRSPGGTLRDDSHFPGQA